MLSEYSFWKMRPFCLSPSSGQFGNRTGSPLCEAALPSSLLPTHQRERGSNWMITQHQETLTHWFHDRSWGTQSPKQCEEMHTTQKTIASQGNCRKETADKHLKQGTHNHESRSLTAGYQMICESRRFRNNFADTIHMRSNS